MDGNAWYERMIAAGIDEDTALEFSEWVDNPSADPAEQYRRYARVGDLGLKIKHDYDNDRRVEQYDRCLAPLADQIIRQRV